METKTGLPVNFLLELQEKIVFELDQIFAAIEMPELKQAVDQVIYLQILADTPPNQFKPDGAAGHGRETVSATIEGAWLLESLAELREREVKKYHAKNQA